MVTQKCVNVSLSLLVSRSKTIVTIHVLLSASKFCTQPKLKTIACVIFTAWFPAEKKTISVRCPIVIVHNSLSRIKLTWCLALCLYSVTFPSEDATTRISPSTYCNEIVIEITIEIFMNSTPRWACYPFCVYQCKRHGRLAKPTCPDDYSYRRWSTIGPINDFQ